MNYFVYLVPTRNEMYLFIVILCCQISFNFEIIYFPVVSSIANCKFGAIRFSLILQMKNDVTCRDVKFRQYHPGYMLSLSCS